jgi:hypothetical protein
MSLNVRSPVIVAAVIAVLVVATGLLAGYLGRPAQADVSANAVCGKVQSGPCGAQVGTCAGCCATGVNCSACLNEYSCPKGPCSEVAAGGCGEKQGCAVNEGGCCCAKPPTNLK